MGRKIAVITPVSHLKEIPKLIETKGTAFYLEKSSKEYVREMLLKFNLDTIICNPNEQKYKIDKELLEGTKINLINSCSTGLNHM